MRVEEAVRTAEAAEGIHNIHAEPRGDIWEILGDVEDEATRQRVFSSIQSDLEGKAVNSLHVIEPKSSRR